MRIYMKLAMFFRIVLPVRNSQISRKYQKTRKMGKISENPFVQRKITCSLMWRTERTAKIMRKINRKYRVRPIFWQ